MKFALTTIALLVSLINPCLAQTPGADGNEQKGKLIEQKIRLIDMLVNSPAAKSAAAGKDSDSLAMIESGRKALEEAKRAYAEGRFDDASKLLDTSLKSASSASRKMSTGGTGLSESAQRKSLADMSDQVATYRAGVVDLTRDPKLGAEAKNLLTRVDALTAESKQLADGGRLGDANKKLASAYKMLVEDLTKLRDGQEVVMSLKFETPADEYAYEQKRFGSSLVMIDMMIDEGRADGQKRKLIDSFVAEGNQLKGQAEAEARSQRHKDAVDLMEKATKQLNRALQSMGIPIF
jgi:hypothetical protein